MVGRPSWATRISKTLTSEIYPGIRKHEAVGGITLQAINRVTGYVMHSAEGAAMRPAAG